MVLVFLLKLFYPISINPATSLIKGKLHPLQSCCMFENDKSCVLSNLYLLEITILDVWKKMLRHTGASTAACTYVSRVSAQRFSIVIMHTKYEKIRTMFVCAKKQMLPLRIHNVHSKKSYFLWKNATYWKGTHFFSRNVALFEWRCLLNKITHVNCLPLQEKRAFSLKRNY